MTADILRVPLSQKKIERIYDKLSLSYNFLNRYEKKSKLKALEISNIQHGSKVLDVGFGTGTILLELAKKVGKKGRVYGLDISKKMIHKSSNILEKNKFEMITNLIRSDANRLPFKDSTFDLVFSSYLLDLIDTNKLFEVLHEFKRVLRSRGRLVVVSLTKGCKWYNNMKIYEWIYTLSPSILGGCRPIFLESYLRKLKFKEIGRETMYAGYLIPIEIIWSTN